MYYCGCLAVWNWGHYLEDIQDLCVGIARLVAYDILNGIQTLSSLNIFMRF